jgi:hypothetical protein
MVENINSNGECFHMKEIIFPQVVEISLLMGNFPMKDNILPKKKKFLNE